MATPGRQRGRVWVPVVTVCVSVTIALLLAEFAIRLVAPQPLVAISIQPDAELAFINTPNVAFYNTSGLKDHPYHVRTNSRGLRMDEEPDFSADARRILALGDSFVYGWSVELENSFVFRLSAAIRRRDGRVQLLNGGVPGYSTGHAFKFLQRHEDLRLSGAIYFMNPNDFEDNLNTDVNYRVTRITGAPDRIQLDDVPAYAPVQRFLLLHTPYSWFNHHSHLFVLSKKSLSAFAHGPETAPAMGAPSDASFRDEAHGLLMRNAMLAHLRRMEDYCREKHIRLLVVPIPNQYELFGGSGAALRFFRAFKEELPVALPPSNGISYCDPTDSFKALNPDAKATYVADGHFTEEGNRMMAAAAEECVTDFAHAISTAVP
jgi:hypothetical protein